MSTEKWKLRLLIFCLSSCTCEISGASPYETLLVADAGDVYLTMYNVPQAADDIYQYYGKLLSTGCKPLTVGGDHTITYPILKAYRVRDALYKLLIISESCLGMPTSSACFSFLLQAMQPLSCHEHQSICLSVHLSPNKMKLLPKFFTPYERPIYLVFWHEERLVGDVPFYLKFWIKLTHPVQKWLFPIYIHS